MHHPHYPKFDLNYSKPIRRRWVDALASGKYTRGSNCLVDADGTCCPLGVLCMEFYEMYPGRVKKDKDDKGRTTFDGEAFVLPFKIAEIVGMTDLDGRFRFEHTKFSMLWQITGTEQGKHGWTCVSHLNDWNLATFADIAEVIGNRSTHIFIEY